MGWRGTKCSAMQGLEGGCMAMQMATISTRSPLSAGVQPLPIYPYTKNVKRLKPHDDRRENNLEKPLTFISRAEFTTLLQ